MMALFFFKSLAKFNKVILPSFSKKGLVLGQASKFELLIIAYRYYITKNSLDD
tara:strand:- start:568 stop:726 length:159 start_codon:yes stop_codon:yes gene_type:complete